MELFSIFVTSIFLITIAFFVHYLDTPIPEGIPEVWNVRILDAVLRTNGKIIFMLHNLGFHAGITRWSRGLVSYSATTLITGRPWGLGTDPRLKITDTKYGSVDVRIYEPTSLDGDKSRPVMVYFHGGGWTWLDVDVYDPVARQLAIEVPMVVVSVGYRRSPKHPHPIPLNDCLEVVNHVMKNAGRLDLDLGRVSIGGDSAGGHLTTAIARRLKGQIKLQVPIYPCLQAFDFLTPSYIENRMYLPGMLNEVSMVTYWMNHGNISYEWINEFLNNNHISSDLKSSVFAERTGPSWYIPEHIRTESLRKSIKSAETGNEMLFEKYKSILLDPDFAPLMSADDELVGLPLTYVLTAGYDVLREDGLMYYQRVKSAGVKAHLAHYPEGFHGMILFTSGPISFQVAKRAMNDLTSFLKENL